MSCARTSETDWAAWAADPSAEEWAELRAHYPGCADCSREAAQWLTLRTALATGPGAGRAHPSEEELLAHERNPEQLPAARRSAIGRHLRDCPRCGNEVMVLNRMLPALGKATAGTGASEPEGMWVRIRASLASALASPGPVVGLTAAGLAVALVVGLALWQGGPSEPGETRYADEPAPPPREPEARAPEPEPAPESLLAEQPQPAEETPAAEAPGALPAPAPEGAAIPEQLAEQSPPGPGPEQLAERTPPAPGPDDWVPPAEESPLVAGPPVELAARLPIGPPSYAADAALVGGDLAATRIDVVIRGRGELPVVRALAPEHTAVTFETEPVLYWHLSAESSHPVEVIVVEAATDELVAERTLAPPVRTGLHAFELAGTPVEPGVEYLFFASIVVDPDRRDRDVTSGFAFRARPDAAPPVGAPAARAHELAAAGSWLDAFATLSGWLAQDVSLERARAHRAALAEQAGLDAVATSLRARR